jgi:hypothetical protein
MKSLLLVVLLFSSCSLTMYDNLSYIGGEISSEYNDYTLDYEVDVETLEELCFYITKNYEYIPSEKLYEYKTPEEVIEDGGGDCKSYTILFIALAKSKFGVSPNFIVATNNGGNHAYAELNGTYYDATWGKVLKEDQLYEYVVDQDKVFYTKNDHPYYAEYVDYYSAEALTTYNYAEALWVCNNNTTSYEIVEGSGLYGYYRKN